MSGIGFSELIILFLIGLIVLGPERLPRVANQLGGWLGQARRMTRVMKRQLEDELNLEKETGIKPPSSVNHPSYVKPADELDDAYSPAHNTDSPGTGVADDILHAELDEDADNLHAEPDEDADNLADDVDSALPEAEPAAEQKDAEEVKDP